MAEPGLARQDGRLDPNAVSVAGAVPACMAPPLPRLQAGRYTTVNEVARPGSRREEELRVVLQEEIANEGQRQALLAKVAPGLPACPAYHTHMHAWHADVCCMPTGCMAGLAAGACIRWVGLLLASRCLASGPLLLRLIRAEAAAATPWCLHIITPVCMYAHLATAKSCRGGCAAPGPGPQVVDETERARLVKLFTLEREEAKKRILALNAVAQSYLNH